MRCLFTFQVSGNLVAFEIATVKETGSHHDRLHLDCGARLNHTMGIVFSAGATESRLRHHDVHRSVAARPGWRSLFSGGQCVRMLFGADAADFAVLRADLGESVETIDSRRFERRPNGSNAAKIEDQSCQNVDCSRYIVCIVMATAVFDFRAHQVR